MKNNEEKKEIILSSRWVSGSEDLSEVMALRDRVYGQELGMPEEAKPDALDPFARHAIFYLDNRPVGSGRIAVDGTKFYVGKLCVLPEARGSQIGDLLARLLLWKASQFADVLHVRARLGVEGFWARFGLKEVGPRENGFVEMSAHKNDIYFPSKCGGDCAGHMIRGEAPHED